MRMTPEQDSFVKTLFEQQFQTMFLYARSALRNAALAEDVVQDCFLEQSTAFQYIIKRLIIQ